VLDAEGGLSEMVVVLCVVSAILMMMIYHDVYDCNYFPTTVVHSKQSIPVVVEAYQSHVPIQEEVETFPAVVAVVVVVVAAAAVVVVVVAVVTSSHNSYCY